MGVQAVARAEGSSLSAAAQARRVLVDLYAGWMPLEASDHHSELGPGRLGRLGVQIFLEGRIVGSRFTVRLGDLPHGSQREPEVVQQHRIERSESVLRPQPRHREVQVVPRDERRLLDPGRDLEDRRPFAQVVGRDHPLVVVEEFIHPGDLLGRTARVVERIDGVPHGRQHVPMDRPPGIGWRVRLQREAGRAETLSEGLTPDRDIRVVPTDVHVHGRGGLVA